MALLAKVWTTFVRPLSQYSDIELRSSRAAECAHAQSKEESNLQLASYDAGDWQPVESDAVAVLCEDVTATASLSAIVLIAVHKGNVSLHS